LTLDFSPNAHLSHLTPVLHLADEPTMDYNPGHRQEFLLNYITAGRHTVLMNGERLTVGEGALWIDSPGEATQQCAVPGQRFSIYHCHFKLKHVHIAVKKVSAAQAMMNRPRTLLLPHHPGSLQVTDSAALIESFTQLAVLQRARTAGHEIEVAARFLMVLSAVSKQMVAQLSPHRASSDASPAQVWAMRAQEYINGHPNVPLSLVDVARHLGLTGAYLSRIFKAHTGMTMGTYVVRRQIDAARVRLLSGHHNIKAVAASLGFNDPLHFSRKFRKMTGMSPRQYLASNFKS
jgi:AraC-like DNA-binding protein